jgi:hypothetical protein
MLFSAYVEFQKMQNTPSNRAITYDECNICPYEQFRIVFEVLSRQCVASINVSEQELELLDFFSIPRKAISMELAQSEERAANADNKKTVVVEREILLYLIQMKIRKHFLTWQRLSRFPMRFFELFIA